MTEPAAPPFHLIEATEEPAIAISPVARTRFETWRAGQSERVRAWIEASGFLADPGTFCLVPGEDGGADRLLAGAEDGEPGGFFTWGALAEKLPARSYRLDDDAATGEMVEVLLKFRRLLTHAPLDGLGGVHIPETDLQGNVHGLLPFLVHNTRKA